jgi:HD-GYP domain-containing protein (c-di-GMP phosphodiesterase class II)
VADLLRQSCRADDVIARMGGDEFFILLPNTDEAKAERIKQRIKTAATKAKLDSIIVSLAIGYCVKKDMNESIEKIMINADNQMYREKLRFGRTMRNQTIETVLRNINYKYDNEQLHTERVSQYCEAIAIALNLSKKEIYDIRVAGSLHDIGKIMVPPDLLNKPGKLNDEEYEIIKRHPETGYQILKSVDEYAALAEYLLYHHERWDGKGYPAGLKGTEIPLPSRIIAVADAYEAMTARRPYQKTRTTEEAKAELEKYAGTQFDPNIVKVFLELI